MERQERPLRPLPPDRYVEFKPVGQGGMGVVYWALDTDLNREVAFKVIRPDGRSPAVDDPSDLTTPEGGTPASASYELLTQRFLQEAWVTSGLTHPGIVPVYELGQTQQGVPYYTMRFVRGERTLARAIEEVREGSFEDRLQNLEPFLKVCDAIRYAHRHGVVHRDLKPENVALGEFGEAVVLDWGLAKFTGDAASAEERWQQHMEAHREATDLRTVASVGTPGYMAPEAIVGKTGEASDVYALGAILYEILTGRRPHQFESAAEFVRAVRTEPAPARSVDPAIPEALSEVCRRALAVDPDKRLESAEALAEGVRAWRAQREVDREIENLLRDAEGALVAADEASGVARLRHADRAAAAIAQVEAKRPESERAAAMAARAARLREEGIRERERASGRRILIRVAVAAVVLTAIGTGFFIYEQQRAQERTSAALEAKKAALRRARTFALANASAAAKDPMEALLLAREAARTLPVKQAMTRLRAALAASLERRYFSAGGSTVTFACYAPDGRTILSTYRGGFAVLWTPEGELLRVLKGHGAALGRVASFSPDGRYVVTASSDGTARIWPTAGGDPVVLRGHDESVVGARFSPSGDQVLTYDARGVVRLWTPEGAAQAVLEMRGQRVGVAIYDDGGDYVAAGCDAGSVTRWNADGSGRLDLEAFAGPVTSVAFRPGSGGIAATSDVGTLRVWDADGELVTDQTFPGRSLWKVAWSPDGDRLAVGTDQEAVVVDPAGKRIATLADKPAKRNSVTWSRDGRRLLLGTTTGEAVLWDVNKTEVLATYLGHDDGLSSARFSPDERRVLTSGRDGVCRIWAVPGVQEDDLLVTVVKLSAMPLSSVRFSPDGARLIVGGTDKKARLLEHQDGEWVVTKELGGQEQHVTSVSFSPRGDRILTSSGHVSNHKLKGSVRLWNASGEPLLVYDRHERGVVSATFAPDGARILSASFDHTARIFDLEGKDLHVIDEKEAVIGARFMPDGVGVVTTLVDGGVHVRAEGPGAEPSHRFKLKHGSVAGRPTLSPDGRHLLVLSLRAGRAHCWDLGTGKETTFTGHKGWLLAAVFSPDGEHVMTSGVDATVRVWDRAGKQVEVFHRGAGIVMDVAYSPSGDRIAMASMDGNLRVWRVGAEHLLALADRRVTRDFLPDERKRHEAILSDE